MDEQEKEILPGVYLTDFRKKEDKKNVIEIINSKENMVEDVIYTINELENSIKHLKRSNEELKIYYKEDPDPLYTDCIKDNESLIKKQSERIDYLKSVLLKLDKSLLSETQS